MLKKLEIDALTADLASVEAILGTRSEELDPSGYFQYLSRKEEIEEELAALGERPETSAELGVFFGGGPVQGSRGINADFAGKALDDLQTLISKKHSTREIGPLATRGRVPRADISQLLVTDVMRGSFGFLLEEAGTNGQIVNTPLKETVAEITDILARVGGADDAVFDEAVAGLDERTLSTLKQFFLRLDESEATLRLVEGNRDFLLDRGAVARARDRTQAIQIEERGEELIGTLFLLPESRKFEFLPQEGGAEVMKGSFGLPVAQQLAGQAELGQDPIDPREIPTRQWQVEIQTRVIRQRHRAPRQIYALTRLIRPVLQT